MYLCEFQSIAMISELIAYLLDVLHEIRELNILHDYPNRNILKTYDL